MVWEKPAAGRWRRGGECSVRNVSGSVWKARTGRGGRWCLKHPKEKGFPWPCKLHGDGSAGSQNLTGRDVLHCTELPCGYGVVDLPSTLSWNSPWVYLAPYGRSRLGHWKRLSRWIKIQGNDLHPLYFCVCRLSIAGLIFINSLFSVQIFFQFP